LAALSEDGGFMRRVKEIIFASALCGGAVALAQVPPKGLTRTDLQRHDVSIAGREAVQTRVEFAPGAVAPWHSHPGEELIYVPEGTLEFQIQGQDPVTLKTGDTYFIPIGAVHMARNRETIRGVELATYIVEKGKPLLMRAENPPKQ
jgi:quercetin dioxygenase-like cupin family protein